MLAILEKKQMNKNFLKISSRLLKSSLLVLVLFASCTCNKVYDNLLDRADSLLNFSKDSAQMVIKILHDVETQLPSLSRKQEMRYQLLYHKAQNKAFVPFKSDSLMLQVVDYYNRYGSANDRILSCYLLGCVYRDMHEVPKALENFNKAVQQADLKSATCDNLTLSRVYGQMSVLFDLQHLPYQEMHSLDSAMKYAYLAKDTLNAIRYFQNKQAAYASLGKVDSAILINNLSSEMFRKHGYQRDADIAMGANFSFYLKKHEVKKAKKAFEHLMKTDFKGNINYEESYAYFLYEQGSYYLLDNKLDSAYISLNKSLQLSKSYSNKAVATRGLAQYYEKTNNPKDAAKYALLSSEYNDSDFVATRNDQLQQMHAMYNYDRHKELAMQAELKAERRTNLIYVIIACGIVVFIIFFIYFRRRINKRNRIIAITHHLHSDSILQLRMAKEELAKLRDYKENAIPVLIQERETRIAQLIEQVKKYEDANITHSLLELDELIKGAPIYERLRYLENHPQKKITKEDWTNLMDTVEHNVYHFAALKQKLSEKEYRICLLVKLRFSPSTISHFIGTSLSDISLSRQRMLAKLCGKAGKAKEFDEYIHNIL